VHLFIDSGNAQVLRVDVAAGDQETGWEERKTELAASIRQAAGDLIFPQCRIDIRDRNVLDTQHVAHLGGQLFTRQLISVELAGVLLLAALVGAIAMAGHGNESLTGQETRGL
jgi:hypothetical protein